MSQHQWFYRTDPVVGTAETLAPFSEPEFMNLAATGSLRRETLIASQSRTKGQWVTVQHVPGLVQALEQGESDRREKREQELSSRKEQAEKVAAAEHARRINFEQPKTAKRRKLPPFRTARTSNS